MEVQAPPALPSPAWLSPELSPELLSPAWSSPELSPELVSPAWLSPDPQLGVSEPVGSLSVRHEGLMTLRAGFVGVDTVVTAAGVFVVTMVGVPGPPPRVVSANTNAPAASTKAAAPTPIIAPHFIRASEPAAPSQRDTKRRSAEWSWLVGGGRRGSTRRDSG